MASARVLRTARLILREATVGDAAFVLRLLNDEAFLRHIGDRGVRSVEEAEAYITERLQRSYREQGFGMWIVEESGSGRVLGLGGLVRREGLEHVDLGYALVPEARGRGVASEVAAAALEFAWQNAVDDVILAIVSRENAASIRVLEKIGFEEAGTVLLPGDTEEILCFEARRSGPDSASSW